MRTLSGKLEFMGKRKFEKEEPRRLVKSGKPGSYYAALSDRSGHQWKPVQPRMSVEELEQQKAHVKRARIIREIMQG